METNLNIRTKSLLKLDHLQRVATLVGATIDGASMGVLWEAGGYKGGGNYLLYIEHL